MVDTPQEPVGPSPDRRKNAGVLFARVYRLEVLLVVGLVIVIWYMVNAVLKMSSVVGPQTEASAIVIKELLDNLKTLLGAFITWGTIIVNGFVRGKDK